MFFSKLAAVPPCREPWLVLWIAVAVLGLSSPCPAQTDPWLEWVTALQSLRTELEALPSPDQRRLAPLKKEIASLEAEIRAWLAARPETKLVVPEPPYGLAGREALLDRVRHLRETVEQVGRMRPNSPFNLGRVEVNVTATAPQVPTAASVEQAEIRHRNYHSASEALNLIPGVTLQRIGSRNETGVFVRGFDVRQVPVYLDGVPVYVPYDGYVDLGRFMVFDVAEVQVSKGFTSPLYGPNAIGGAVNLISIEPAKKLNLDAGAGYGSGRQFHGFLNAGTRWKPFWLQGGFSGLNSDFFPLSDGYETNPVQPTRERLNAYSRDYKGTFKAAWTPNSTDQYVFSYLNQQAEKGNPLYAGSDPTVRVRYWQWPQWDKEGFYLSGNKGLGLASYVRARLYYDKFNNFLSSYDDATYSTQNRRSSFNSPYDDDTYGTIAEFGTRAFRGQTLKTSFYFKDDTHREGNIGQPQRAFRDRSFSLGFEDTIRLARGTRAIVGFSSDYLTVLNAQDFQDGEVLPLPHSSIWAFNPQAGIFHTVSETGRIHFTFARKTRLPTIKDRYSYALGRAIPNPDLQEEIADNLEVGYSRVIGTRTHLEVAAFRSGISNSIQPFFLEPNLFQLRNVGTATYLGAEFSVRGSPIAALTLTARCTYLNRRNETHPELRLVDAPRHKVRGTVSYQVLKRVLLLADVLFETGRWTLNDAGRYSRASQYADVGLASAIDLGSGVELQAGAHNLFDRNYFFMEGYPEPGRTGYFTLRYRF